MKKVATYALSLLVCFSLANMIGCRKFDKKTDKKTTKTLEKSVDAKKVKIKEIAVKEPAELG